MINIQCTYSWHRFISLSKLSDYYSPSPNVCVTGFNVIGWIVNCDQVQIFTRDGAFVRKFGATVLQHPRGVTVDFRGRIVVVECKVSTSIFAFFVPEVMMILCCCISCNWLRKRVDC